MNKRIFSFHYTLHDADGQLLGSSDGEEPLSVLEGAGQVVPGLESELVAMGVGEKRQVALKAANAYGPRDPELVLQVPKEKLSQSPVKVGDRFRPANQPIVLTVTAVNPTHVTLDGNHPLAGQDLTFDVELVGVRDATTEELEDSHGCCGHHLQGGCGEHDHDHDCDHGHGCSGC